MRRGLRELGRWAKLASSTAAGFIVQELPDLISMIYLGRIGIDELAAVSVAATWAYGIAQVIWVGFAIAQGSLGSQAAGARSYVGVFGWTFLRGIVSMIICLAVILPIFLTGHAVLAKIGFASVRLDLVQEYLLWSLPVPFMVTLIETLACHMTATQRAWQPLAAELLYAGTDIAAGYVLIIGIDTPAVKIPSMGVRGAALANIISCALCLLVYLVFFWLYAMPPEMQDESDSDESETPELLADDETAARKLSAISSDTGSVAEGLSEPLLATAAPLLSDFEAAAVPTAAAVAPTDLAAADETGRTQRAAAATIKDAVLADAAASDCKHFTIAVQGTASLNAAGAAVAAGSSTSKGGGATPATLAAEPTRRSSKASRASTSSSSSSSTRLSHSAAKAAVSWSAVWRFATARKNILTFARQSSSAIFCMALEIGQSMLLSFLAADMGTVQVATQNALGELFQVGAMIIFGFGDSVAIRVGHALGAGRIAAAKLAAWVPCFAMMTWATVAAGVLIACRSVVFRLFSDDPAVIEAAASVVPWAAASYVAYAAYIHAACVLDGQGRIVAPVIVSLIGCWCVTATLASLSLRFTNFGVPGLWGAELVGNAVAAVISIVLVLRSDWRALSLRAMKRSAE